MALYRAMCNCNFTENSSSSQIRELINCNADQWPVGHKLLINANHYEIENTFANHYNRLSRAYWTVEPREMSYLRCLPKDMQQLINANLIQVIVTKPNICINSFGIAHMQENVPCGVTYNSDGRVGALEFKNFVCNGARGEAVHSLISEYIKHFGVMPSGIYYEFMVNYKDIKPEVRRLYMNAIVAGLAEFKRIVLKHLVTNPQHKRN